jgi:hypothetical protein
LFAVVEIEGDGLKKRQEFESKIPSNNHQNSGEGIPRSHPSWDFALTIPRTTAIFITNGL